MMMDEAAESRRIGRKPHLSGNWLVSGSLDDSDETLPLRQESPILRFARRFWGAPMYVYSETAEAGGQLWRTLR